MTLQPAGPGARVARLESRRRTRGPRECGRGLTERARAEPRLLVANDFLATVTKKMADGVFTTDGEGRVTYMNEAAERLLGWTLDELRGRVVHMAAHYRDADGSLSCIEQCPITTSRRENRKIHVTEDHFIRRDGTNMPVEYTSTPFTTDDGEVASVVLFSDC